jgi:predicted permease
MLRRDPTFATIAILTLSLGIGATTAVFTVVDAVVLRSLGYPDADRIVAVNTRFTDESRSIWRMTGGDLEDLRADRDWFEAFSFSGGGGAGVQLAKSAEFAPVYLVDTEMFRVFSIAPVAGRTFVGSDAGVAAVVGLELAQRNFGSAAEAIGQKIGIDGRWLEIVGVVPKSFDFPSQAQVWVAGAPVPENRNRSSYNYRVVAKLKPGLSLAAANARLRVIGERLAGSFPDDNRDKTFVLEPLQAQLATSVRPTLLLLSGAVGLLLLISCANVANLLLARATERSRELAVRTALGAGRRDLVTQLFLESGALALPAALLGVGFAAWGTRAMLGFGAHFVPPGLAGRVALDGRVLVFALAVSLGTTLLVGIGPAWQASRRDAHDALKQGGTRGLVGGGRSRLRSSLVVGQIGLSLMLAIGAGLLFRTMLALDDVDLGYRAEGALVAYTHVPAPTRPEALRNAQALGDLLERLRRLPGVVSAAGAVGVPAGPSGSNGYLAIEGKQTFDGDYRRLPQAGFRAASPGYFRTLGVPLLSGREFDEGDVHGRPQTVIISESLRREVFPNEDPLGQRVICGLDEETMAGMTIVGVVGDLRQDSPAARPGPELYVPLGQHPDLASDAEIVVRTSVDPEALIPSVRNAVREMNPQVATAFTTLDKLVHDSISAQRFRAVLASSFALLALALALLGMYAVMSYVTARRTSEFGLRSALGAQPGNLLSLVLGGAAKLAALGIVVGVLLSLAVSRLLAAMLFGLDSIDLKTYVVVTALVLPAMLLAAALPAWRASTVDPTIALRNE